MRAAVAWEAGAGLVVEDDVVRREVGAGEVVVRIRAAGVCQTDISLSHGAFGQPMPVVLGHEGAGEVIEVGPGVTDVVVGARVVLTWVPPCGRCYFCVRGETYICAGRRRASQAGADGAVDLSVRGTPVLQGMGTSTFAEETIVPAAGVIAIPDDLRFEHAALLGCAMPTGLGAVLGSGRLAPGETVLVIGCGAVGLAAVQGALVGGASSVVAVDPQPARQDAASALGATALAPDALAAATRPHGVGFDLAVDAVGGSRTIRAAWDAVRRGGRAVAVGAGKADDTVSFSALELFHDQKQLIGSFYGSADMRFEVPRMVALWRAGRLDLDAFVAGLAPLDDINDVIRRQTSGEAVRVMVSP